MTTAQTKTVIEGDANVKQMEFYKLQKLKKIRI